MCFQKLWKMQFYITKHFKRCSTSNRDHCGNISVIFNIFWEQKYWWQVWFLRGSVSQWPVVYLWTGRANVRSELLLDLHWLMDSGSLKLNSYSNASVFLSLCDELSRFHSDSNATTSDKTRPLTAKLRWCLFLQFHMFPTVWSYTTTIGLLEFYIRVRLKVTFTVT